MKKNESVVVVGDTHFPYHDKAVLLQILNIIKEQKPTYVVQIGDLYDFFHFSRYPKSMLKFTPEEEVLEARANAESFWNQVQKLSPKSKCYQLLGNHDVRPIKRLLDKAPELEAFFNVDSLFKFKGVTTMTSDRQELTLNLNGEDIMFLHGHRSQLGSHMLYNEMSTVCGHSHTGGVVYKHYKSGTRYELNAGFVANASKGPLQYGAQTKKYWTLGVGLIDQYGPRFIPLS